MPLLFLGLICGVTMSEGAHMEGKEMCVCVFDSVVWPDCHCVSESV